MVNERRTGGQNATYRLDIPTEAIVGEFEVLADIGGEHCGDADVLHYGLTGLGYRRELKVCRIGHLHDDWLPLGEQLMDLVDEAIELLLLLSRRLTSGSQSSVESLLELLEVALLDIGRKGIAVRLDDLTDHHHRKKDWLRQRRYLRQCGILEVVAT